MRIGYRISPPDAGSPQRIANANPREVRREFGYPCSLSRAGETNSVLAGSSAAAAMSPELVHASTLVVTCNRAAASNSASCLEKLDEIR